MSLAAIKSVVTSKIGRQILIGQKHSPVLLFGTGLATFVGTVVLAVRATQKLDGVFEEAEARLDKMDPESAQDSDEAAEFKKASVKIRLKTATKVAKLYAPVVATGVISIGCFTGSHVILTRRNAGLMAAYATLDQALKDYRERVKKEYGEEKEVELFHGLVDKEIAVETDEGPVVKTVKTVGPRGLSQYAVCFEKSTSVNWEPSRLTNTMFINAAQTYANNLLQGRGHLFLNDVFDMLGMPRTRAGSQVGWLKGGQDDFVDFGIFEGDPYMGMQFVSGNERSVWLDFNVDGVIWDKI